ncbi:hypothetical protein [Metabacillus arenae]|uniref:DUF5082 domain-containing protein n=1 Tax=Metabacillus arenae TaxID=2771434 RepID=A0A926NK13_9BACI|nr:hypothetical protein [Metabacillus arenae]MBD1381383.1 hypothetical protein [Metabacillus arenae]
MLDSLSDIERQAKKLKIQMEVESLEAYLFNVRNALSEFRESIDLYQRGNQLYASSWKGRAADAYQRLVSDLSQLEAIVTSIGFDLQGEISREIDRLLQKAEDYR